MTKQREKLGTKGVDVDRNLLHDYQDAAKRLGYGSGRELVEEALRAQWPKVEKRLRREKKG